VRRARWAPGSQVPLTLPRSDARQNLVDALTCATSFFNPPHTHLQAPPPGRRPLLTLRPCRPRAPAQRTPVTDARASRAPAPSLCTCRQPPACPASGAPPKLRRAASGEGEETLPLTSRAPQEVAVCFGARLMRGNRVQKVHSSAYRAFDSLTYPPLATLGVDVEWGHRYLLQVRRPPPGRRRVSPSTRRTLTAGPPVLCTRP